MNENQKQFHIYGRKSYDKPLEFVAELAVEEKVKEEALAQVGSDEWIELVAIPTAAILQVTGKKENA